MNQKEISKHFRRSRLAGVIYELVTYGLLLLCGYFLSELLEAVMAGAWQFVYRGVVCTLFVLLIAVVPKVGLTLWRSRVRFSDVQDFRESLYQSILCGGMEISDRGEMNVRMNSDVKTIADYYGQTIPKAVSGATIMLCSTIMLCGIDWRIGLLFFALNLMQLIPVLVYEKWSRKIYNQTHSDEDAYCNWMLEGYGGIRTIKAYRVEDWFMRRFYKLNSAIVESGKQAEHAVTVENIIFSAIDSLLNYGSYVVIGLFVLYGGLRITDIPLIVILAGYLFSSISAVFEWRMQQFQYQEACKRLRFKIAEDGTEGKKEILAVSHIEKSYGEKKVLSNATCTIYAGERVLLKGENGSGKSTLLRIMMGIETADRGEIYKSFAKEDWAFVLQEEPELNIPAEELLGAMKESNCINMDKLRQHLHEFGIGELCSKSLSELSPGERKKFYLSVALAHQGKLLILDEPTNHIDWKSILYLKKQLCMYTGTLLICTHDEELDLHWSRTILVEGGICYES